MYELHYLKGNTYYIDGPTNCGVYILNQNKDILLFDTGTQEDGVEILKTIKKHGFNVKYIVFSHCHSDHSQGSLEIKKEFPNVIMITSKVERGFFRDPKLDIGFLYGGYPLDEYDGKLMHFDMNDEIYALDKLPNSVSYFHLPGHHPGMIGLKTDDDVYFVADTLGSKELVDKAHILLIYDVKGYLESLDFVESLDSKIVVPSHSVVSQNIAPLVKYNRDNVNKIISVLLDFLHDEHNCTECTSYIFTYFNLKISYNKYMLILSTIRSYLSYLSNKKVIRNYFKDNRLVFKFER